MRLLIAADIFPPESGGPATYAVTLANALAAEGELVSIVSLNANSNTSVVSCPVYKVSSTSKMLRYLEYVWLLYKHAKNADLIYAMGPVNAGLPALIVAKLRGKKLAVKVVGDYAWESYQNAGIIHPTSDFVSVDAFQALTMSGKIGRLQKTERLVCCHANVVITPSEYLKKIVIGWGVNAGNIKVVYNAVEVKDVAVLPKPQNEKWIVSAARLVPWKGIHTLIAILPEIVKQIPTAKLKIIGDGPEMSALQKQSSVLNLQSSIEFTGNLEKSKALSYVQAADVFVLNSGYEGLSHVILEALRLGRTVLASSSGGNPEIVHGSDYVFTYNNATEITEKIIKVLQKDGVVSNHDMLHRLVEADFMTQFNLKNMVAVTKETLEKICAS